MTSTSFVPTELDAARVSMQARGEQCPATRYRQVPWRDPICEISCWRPVSVCCSFSIDHWLLPRAQPSGFQAPDDLQFRRESILSEGTRMAAEVFAPKAPKSEKLPTIVMSHGWGGTAAALRPDAIAFARAGYLVVTFDYRGWGKSDSRLILAGKPPEKKDGKLIAEVKEVREVVDPIDQTTDILNAIHWVGGREAVRPRAHRHLGLVVLGRSCRLRRGPRSAGEGVRQPGRLDGRRAGPSRTRRCGPTPSARRPHALTARSVIPDPARNSARLTGQPVIEKLAGLCADRGHRPLQGLREAVHHRRERGAIRQQGPRDPGLRAGHGRQEARDRSRGSSTTASTTRPATGPRRKRSPGSTST